MQLITLNIVTNVKKSLTQIQAFTVVFKNMTKKTSLMQKRHEADLWRTSCWVRVCNTGSYQKRSKAFHVPFIKIIRTKPDHTIVANVWKLKICKDLHQRKLEKHVILNRQDHSFIFGPYYYQLLEKHTEKWSAFL